MLGSLLEKKRKLAIIFYTIYKIREALIITSRKVFPVYCEFKVKMNNTKSRDTEYLYFKMGLKWVVAIMQKKQNAFF